MLQLIFSTGNFLLTVFLIMLPYIMVITGGFFIHNNILSWALVTLGVVLALITRPVTSLIKGYKQAEKKNTINNKDLVWHPAGTLFCVYEKVNSTISRIGGPEAYSQKKAKSIMKNYQIAYPAKSLQ